MSKHLDSLLDRERLAECERHDAHQKAEQQRVLRGQPYRWPQVEWRTERRTGPRVWFKGQA